MYTTVLTQGPKSLCMTAYQGDSLARSHMIQQILVAVQRGNAISVLGTFEHCNPLENYNYKYN